MKTMGVNSSYYDNELCDKIDEKYLPCYGEGDTMATQLVTALNKIIYKWYNDGDVYDNNYYLEGWCNDLSSYANWIYKHYPTAREVLDRIKIICCDEEYEHLLKDLWDLFADIEFFDNENKKEKIDSIYKGISEPFSFNDDEDNSWY